MFLFQYRFQEKIEPSWRNHLISRIDWSWEYNTGDTLNTLIIRQLQQCKWLFWLKIISAFRSDYRNSFNCKLKRFINEQIILFHSPSDALCSSEESAQIKHFKHHTFIGVSFSFFFILQNTLSFKQIEQMCKCALLWKPVVFIILPLIHN